MLISPRISNTSSPTPHTPARRTAVSSNPALLAIRVCIQTSITTVIVLIACVQSKSQSNSTEPTEDDLSFLAHTPPPPRRETGDEDSDDDMPPPPPFCPMPPNSDGHVSPMPSPPLPPPPGGSWDQGELNEDEYDSEIEV
jgi:hypothetical protein